MTSVLSSPTPGAVVIDANVVIALCAKEAGRETLVLSEFRRYTGLGYQFFAPGVLLSEALYALCGKVQNATLTTAGYNQAIVELQRTMSTLQPPPTGDAALATRAAEIRGSYGCSRSADAIYIALAELLAQTRPTVLLTFDQGMPNQAAANAPTVTVQVLIV